MGQCCNLCVDCGYVYAVFVGKFTWADWVDGVRNLVGNCFVWFLDEDKKSKATTKMDGGVICCDGVDAAVYFACNDSQYSRTWPVVYFGGRIGIHDWCDILSVAADEVFARCVAPVCDRRDGVFLFCRSVWMHFGFVNGVYDRYKSALVWCRHTCKNSKLR